MTEHHFKIQHAEFTAEIVLGGKWMLYDLAEFIIQTVGFDFDHAFEFCDNLKNPHRSKERYTLYADIRETDEPEEPGVKYTPIAAVFRPRRKMIFHFDFGEDWFFLVTCTAVKESAQKRRFRSVLATTGTLPVQYADPDA